MKKILILVGLFLIALVAGFLYADWKGIFPTNSGDQSTPSQVNYLIIRVDDLNKPRPTLQTVWGAFISFANLTSVYFHPIYPARSNRADLAALFTLTDQRLPSEAFIKGLERYELDLAGYIILDNQGEQLFFNWMVPVPKTSLPASTRQPGSLMDQRQNFNRLCQGLNSNNFSVFTPPDWKSVYPDHLIPSPNIESVMVLFDRLIYRTGQCECQVLEE